MKHVVPESAAVPDDACSCDGVAEAEELQLLVYLVWGWLESDRRPCSQFDRSARWADFLHNCTDWAHPLNRPDQPRSIFQASRHNNVLDES
jgi:hypothetical protein